MKKISFLLFFSLSVAVGHAQTTAASYGFTAYSGAFSLINGTSGVTAVSMACDDCNVTSIPIGFTFNFCGVNHTTLSAGANGFLSLNNTATVSFSNAAGNVPAPGHLMAYWDDLTGLGSAPTPGACYITTGSAPNRVFTFEWKTFGSAACVGCYASFQVKLYETSNMIDFVYGPGLFTGTSATIGIANSTTDWQTLSDVGFTPISSSAVFTTSISGSPNTGQVYRYNPPCTGTPIAGTVNSSLSAGCVSYNSNLTLALPPASIPGLIYQWQSSPTGSSWTNITGATNNNYMATVTGTTYYRNIVSCTNSGMINGTPAVELFINAPAPITGSDTVCVSATTYLSDATAGGVWSSGNTLVATVDASGVVTGVTAGATTIAYAHAGCAATHPLNTSSCITGTSTVNTVDKGLYVYPNPNNGTFTINVSSGNNEQANVIITDLLGKQVKRLPVHTNTPVDLKFELPKGIYFISTSTSSGNYTMKMVLE